MNIWIFVFLNEHEGKKEIVVNDDSIIFKYNNSSEEKEMKIAYLDIINISLYRFKEVYLLSIETKESCLELNIDIDDIDKINKCKTLYRKVSSALCNNYSKDDLDCEYKEDSSGELIEYRIDFLPKEHSLIQTKLIAVMTLILFAVVALNMFKIV